jgi:uncharacterized membrane protein
MFRVSRIISNVIHLVLSIILAFLSIHLIHYAVGHILNSFRVENPVDEIFSAIWLVTVAFAVFDLAIIIFDHIVWTGKRKKLMEFKSSLIKFLIVIITALSIESLVIFFRISKKDVTLLVYPAIAVISICLLVISLAVYIRVGRDQTETDLADPLQMLKIMYAKGEIDKTEFENKMECLRKITLHGSE